MANEVEAREFTRKGIARARLFLREVREAPAGPIAPPPALLTDREFTRPSRTRILVARPHRPFRTRREIAEYLAPRLSRHRAWIADRTPFWSWLGIFHFEDTVRIVDGLARLSPLDETFVVDAEDSQNYRGFHRHYLRTAWQLQYVYGEKASYLLDRPPTDRGNLSDRTLQSQRIFNSVGVIPLVLRLYTTSGSPDPKVGHMDRLGGLRHLVRVLDQLERTYDVYGMDADALIKILPPEFDLWINSSALPEDVPDEADRKAAATDSPSTDPALVEWEKIFWRNRKGRMSYDGCQATLACNDVGNVIEGPITDADNNQIGWVHARNAADVVRQIRRQVIDRFS